MKTKTKIVYSCERCGRSFFRESSCKRHEEMCQCKACLHFARHSDIPGRLDPYTCDMVFDLTPGCMIDDPHWTFDDNSPFAVPLPCPDFEEVPECPKCGGRRWQEKDFPGGSSCWCALGESP